MDKVDPRNQAEARAIAQELRSTDVSIPFVREELLRKGFSQETLDALTPELDRQRVRKRRKMAEFNLLCGGGLIGLGFVLTAISYTTAGEGPFSIYYGAMVVGGFQFLGGLLQQALAGKKGD